jgi:hypothetical protein
MSFAISIYRDIVIGRSALMRLRKFQDVFIGLLVFSMGGWSVASFATSVKPVPGFAGLTGAAGCDKCSCSAQNKHLYECQHDNPLNAAVKCSTTGCIEDWLFYAACPPKDKGDACKLGNNPAAIGIVQTAQDGAPADCGTVNQGINTYPSNGCGEPAYQTRCEIPSCGGSIIFQDTRLGQSVCLP